MDLALMQRVLPFFLEAAWVTVQISVLALLLGFVVAGILVIARLSNSAMLRFLSGAYISVFRGTPCLVQLFVLYFGGPQIGLELEPYSAGVIGLGLNIGAYMAESIRGAIASVDRGQMEAARDCKLKCVRAFFHSSAIGILSSPNMMWKLCKAGFQK